MKKADLRTGMLVETRMGTFGLVMRDTPNGDIFGGDGDGSDAQDNTFWSPFDCHNEDLTRKVGFNGDESKTRDIIRVYSTNFNISAAALKPNGRSLLWERKEEKIEELTIEQIQEKLGYKIKIVK